MDKTEAIKIAKRYARELKKKLEYEEIYLFGSYSRENYHGESDIDIAVILSDFDNILDIRLELMRIRRDIDSRIEPHPIRVGDFNGSNPLAYEIMRHGLRIL